MDKEKERDHGVVGNPRERYHFCHGVNKGVDAWALIGQDIKLLPRLTLALVDQVGYRKSPELTVEAIRGYVAGLPKLPSRKGVFVTLQRRGSLHGCIGTFGGRKGCLLDRVMAYTLHSTFEDKRFSGHSLRQVHSRNEAWTTRHWKITTTLLGQSFDVPPSDFYHHFRPGRHGIVLYHQGKSATFLPKVIMRWWPPRIPSSPEGGPFGGTGGEQGAGEEEDGEPCAKRSRADEDSSGRPDQPVPVRSLADLLSESERVTFEKDLFGALFAKMGFRNLRYSTWRRCEVHLYEGEELEDD